MATDEERLLVRIEAQLRQFEKAMAQATGSADRAAGRIERRFKAMDRSLAGIGARVGRSLVGPIAALASAQQLGQAINAFTRIENALKVAGLEGEELTSVFNRLFAAAQKNAAPVESLVELYSRAAIVQKELGVSTEELLNFTEGVAAALRVSGKTASESSGALLQLAQALGSGTVRAEEFNSILEGALPIAQAAARGLEEAGGSVAKLRQLVIDGRVSSEAFFKAFEAGQGTLETLAATTEISLAGAFTRLQNELIKAVGSLNETYNISGTLAQALGDVSNAIVTLIGWLNSLAQPIEDIDAKYRSLINTLNDFVDSIPGAGTIGKALGISNEESKRINDAAATAAAMRTDLELAAKLQAKARQQGDLIAGPAEGVSRTVSLRDFAAPVASRGGASTGSRQHAAAAARQERDAVADLITELQEELRLVGATDTERRVSNELRHAGADATDAQKRAITDLVTRIEEEEKAQQAVIDRLDDLRFAAGSALDSFVQSISSGEGAAAGLKAALSDILQTIIRIGEQKAITSLFGAPGTTGGGLFSGIIGGLFGGGGSLAAASSIGSIAGPASFAAKSQVPIVQVQVKPGQMFEPIVTGIAGAVSIRHANDSEQRATSRAPALARDNARRFGTP